MNMKRQLANFCCIGLLLALSMPAWADDTTPPPKTTPPDVTMTVIPDGKDVVQTVVQNISVPAAVSNHKPGPVPQTGSKADNGEQFGQDTAAAAKAIEETREASAAAQHEVENASQQAENTAQQAKDAAQQQADQARQNSQNSQTGNGSNDHPAPPTPPVHPTPPSRPTPPRG